ncbi:Arc family DNA-binding protein [Sinorhizobium fredii]|uniref:Arc family DNA-binding protein n=1 Tax=Rhizobium fredii TaxID=380 RepID=UPI0004B555B9|nr:Arc family DNA-binding protein [Sinorhizobium fredii]
MAKAGRGADQYMLRFPDGLRDRIKAYAERVGTSINSEIVRVLEREFPEQWTVDNRLEELEKMLSILSAGRDDPRLDEFVQKFEETVEGIVSGRVIGVDPETRDAVSNMWGLYKTRESEAALEEEQDAQMDYTEEELEAYGVTGRFEKYAVPPPKKPDPFSDELHLRDILPPRSLAELAEKLGKGDLEAAAKVVASMPKQEIEERIKFLQLPVTEQYRRRGEVPPADPGTDPFER